MSGPEFLTLGEVAAYLGWTPRFVERLATGGNLPGVESEGQWRFRRADLIDWLDQKIQTLDTARVAELEHRLEAELQAGNPATPRAVQLFDRFGTSGVALNAHADAKGAVLRELVELAERTGQLVDRNHLQASLAEREALCSTALPGGFAICHPRRPIPFALRAQLICLMRTARPVPFGGEGGEPTQLFFLFSALDERSHLHGLARLVRLLRGPTLEELRSARTDADVVTILQSREKSIDSGSPASAA